MAVDSLGEIVFVDPGNAFEDSAGFYIYERSFLGYKAYKDFLEKNYPEVKCSVVTEGGVIDFKKCPNPSTCRRISRMRSILERNLQMSICRTSRVMLSP